MASLLKAKHEKTGLKMAEEEGLKIASTYTHFCKATFILKIDNAHVGTQHQIPRKVKRKKRLSSKRWNI